MGLTDCTNGVGSNDYKTRVGQILPEEARPLKTQIQQTKAKVKKNNSGMSGMCDVWWEKVYSRVPS